MKITFKIDHETQKELNSELQRKDRYLNMRIDEEFDELLKSEAKKNGMSVSDYVRFVVRLLSKTNIIDLLRVK